MKAGDVSGVRISSQETWLSTPLSDSNAALWASITPPANPTLKTRIRRRAAAFSFDLLAQRLHLRYPETFASRGTARLGMLGAAFALVAAGSAAAYFTWLQPSHSALAQSTSGARAVVRTSGASAQASQEAAASTSFVRLGQTALEPISSSRAAAPVPTERVVQALTPRAALADTSSEATSDATAAIAKGKRSLAKKKVKSTRRVPKFRRARIITSD